MGKIKSAGILASKKKARQNEINLKLAERIKELNCLYGISKLVENGFSSLDQVLQGAVDLIPYAWQYPEITCARIKIKRRQYITPGFGITAWKQSEDININGEIIGQVDVYYREEKTDCDEGPFLKEERVLLHAIAERLGHIIARKLDEDRLKLLYQKEKELSEKLQTEMQSKIDFTRRLIHELKTPLTPLLATSQIIRDETKGKKIGKLAGYIWGSACSMNNRINELHDFIRGEIGQLEVKSKKVDLNTIIDQTVNESKALAQKNNMVIEVNLARNLPPVYADDVRIRQVLLNLLSNAFKHANEGGKVIIKAKAETKNVIMEVRDFGPGINPAEKKLIFEPYYRSTSKRDYAPGLGIGLALCKVLVESMGGIIWVRSELNKGASFYVKLPIYTGESL